MIQEVRIIIRQEKSGRPGQDVVVTTKIHLPPLMIHPHIITGSGKG
jgi:hypothetical protein